MKPRAQAGFTLLETLVALVVLGFLMTGLVQGLRLGVVAWQMQSRRLAEQGDIDASDRTLRSLIARMDPGGFSPQKPPFAGNARGLVFTATLPEAAGALAVREADVTLGVTESHDMQLLWLAHYRNRVGQPPAPDRVVLRHDVDHLEIAYWHAAKTGWQPEWIERALPKLIRIRVVPTSGDKHAGPDIVIAPMRDRWRQ
jgi:prepilin-type N-terminal cleavage/methylation domain-containing protein